MRIPKFYRIFVMLAAFAVIFTSHNVFAQKRGTARRGTLTQTRTTPEPNNTASDQEGSTASLQETMEWIKGKINTQLFTVRVGEGESRKFFDGIVQFKDSPSNWSTAMNYDGCNMTITHSREKLKFSGEDFPGEKFQGSISFSLAEIEPLSIKLFQTPQSNPLFREIPDYYVTMSTTNSKDVINYSASTGSSKFHNILFGVTETDSSGYNFREISKRMISAFQHAVKLCGGKVEPF